MKCRLFRRHLNVGVSTGVPRSVSRTATLCRLLLCAICLISGSQGCKPAHDERVSVTITLLDPGWLERGFLDWRRHEMEQFKRETGISVKLLPAPETVIDQLALWRKLLETPSDAPDVFAIDVIWPALMAPYAMSLDPSVTNDTAGDFPFLLPNNTVNGTVVAMPYHIDAGLLFYRSDLLKEYGYRAPPKTWGDLEKMATRIQRGERAKGNRDFWGFVWQGSASEALTCNALEWQVADGGGTIIEKDRTISVNNHRALRSWRRAAQWVGTISPPGVTAYREWDALNIWRTGKAAFMRNWPTGYLTSRSEGSIVADRFAATLLPAGLAGIGATMGGSNLSIFRGTKHPEEARALVRFLCRRDVQKARAITTSQPPTFVDLYDDAEVLKANPHFAELKNLFLHDLTMRPSGVLGDKYTEVSVAYFQAVHDVLLHKVDSSQVGEKLQAELVHITGFPVAGATGK